MVLLCCDPGRRQSVEHRLLIAADERTYRFQTARGTAKANKTRSYLAGRGRAEQDDGPRANRGPRSHRGLRGRRRGASPCRVPPVRVSVECAAARPQRGRAANGRITTAALGRLHYTDTINTLKGAAGRAGAAGGAGQGTPSQAEAAAGEEQQEGRAKGRTYSIYVAAPPAALMCAAKPLATSSLSRCAAEACRLLRTPVCRKLRRLARIAYARLAWEHKARKAPRPAGPGWSAGCPACPALDRRAKAKILPVSWAPSSGAVGPTAGPAAGTTASVCSGCAKSGLAVGRPGPAPSRHRLACRARRARWPPLICTPQCAAVPPLPGASFGTGSPAEAGVCAHCALCRPGAAPARRPQVLNPQPRARHSTLAHAAPH